LQKYREKIQIHADIKDVMRSIFLEHPSFLAEPKAKILVLRYEDRVTPKQMIQLFRNKYHKHQREQLKASQTPTALTEPHQVN
jgi:hypothetical protein